nr:MAG TPA: hypothetical protein [Crassvirales sp.]
MSIIILTIRRHYNSVNISCIFRNSFPILFTSFNSIISLLFGVSLFN